MSRAVVVGSGPNGLSAACVLAGAGWEVEVFEAAQDPGGALGGREDGGAVRDGGWSEGNPAFAGLERTVEALGVDGPRWRRLFAPLVRHDDELADTVLSAPVSTLRMLLAGAPVLSGRFDRSGVNTLPRAGRTAAAVSIGALPASVLMRGFRTEEARALLAGLAAHSTADLRLPLTGAFGLMFAAVGHSSGWPVVRGGSQRLVDALVHVLVSEGGTLTTGHRVTDLAALRREREADVVLADLTPAQLLALDARGAEPTLDARVRRRLRGWEPGPGIVKVDWLLDGPVPWRHPELTGTGTVHLGGPSAQVVAAEAALARGVLPARPTVLFTQPAAVDPSRTAAGRQTCSAYAHVPRGLSGAAVDRVAAMIEAEVAAQAPGFGRAVVRRRVWSPADLQEWNPNLAGGSLSGGVPTPGQMLRRPASFRRPYRMGPGLYLCSSSTPPGGGAHGMSGASAAAAVLADVS